jgi:succinate dehydrogenase / fumarate reductase cytochrome b subunit
MEARSAARRLHSLTGLVPVGAFLVFHLRTNTESARGADAYDAAARRLQGLPFSLAAEILLIALPLVFHGVYGLYLSAAVEPGSPRPTRARVALSRLQRATGLVVFVFLFFHLWTARLVQIRDHPSVDLFRLIQAALASRWIYALYVAGILAAIVHLAAGVWTSADAWGLLRTRGARAITGLLAAAVFAVLAAWGAISLRGFALTP